MFRNPVNIYELLCPIFSIWKYVALPFIKLEVNENGNRFIDQNSKRFYLGIMILLTVFYLVLKKIYTDENNVVVFSVGLFEIVFVFLQDLIIIVFTNKRRKEICSLISKYATLERLTNKLKKCKSTYHVQVRNTIMKIVLVEFVLTIICCVVDCVNNPNEGVNTVVYFTLWSFHFYYELVILTFLEVLLNQYRELANYMIKKNRCSEKKIKEVLKIYLFIRQIFHLTKKYFQGIILAKTLTDLFISTTGIYYHIRIMVHNENKNYISKYGLASTWLVLISISNFIVVYFCQIITQQVPSFFSMSCVAKESLFSRTN